MRNNRLLVLVNNEKVSDFQSRIASYACPGWGEQVEIRSIEGTKSTPISLRASKAKENADQILADWHDGKFIKLILDSSTLVDKERLEKAEIKISEVKSLDVAVERTADELKTRMLHWLPYSENQWNKSAIKYLHPDGWREQFAKLGYKWIGEGLSKLVRVISESELRDNFHSDDTSGQQVIHAYFSDAEPGSSSLSVQSVLQHLYPKDVLEIKDASSLASILALGKNVIFLYEDGLWSGVELVKRLKALNGGVTTLKNLPIQIYFKFGATCDVGLTAGRAYTGREGLTNVIIFPSSKEYHFKFFKSDADRRLSDLYKKNDDEVRTAINDEVAPYAFQSQEIWAERHEEAMRVCTELGKQLVRSNMEFKGESPTDMDLEMRALGTGCYGSTIVFSSSVPKPVLPLFWLDGDVTIGEKRIQWRPLFWDARRIGRTPPKN